MGPEVGLDRGSQYPKDRLGLTFPELRWNPFLDRIFKVFSTSTTGDETMSFEDLLNFYSVLNKKCPEDVKAMWAFQLFDFDGDGQIGQEDLEEIIQRLTSSSKKTGLLEEEKRAIARKILIDMDLDKTGGVTSTEFAHAVVKIPDFTNSFRL